MNCTAALATILQILELYRTHVGVNISIINDYIYIALCVLKDTSRTRVQFLRHLFVSAVLAKLASHAHGEAKMVGLAGIHCSRVLSVSTRAELG